MDNSTVEKIATKAAEQAIRSYTETSKKAEKKKMLHNTFALMENYASLKKYATTAISESSQIKKSEFPNAKNEYLKSIRKSRVKTELMIAHIDTALKELKKECNKRGESYKYEAFEMHYIKGMSYEQIQDQLNSGKNSPSRWCKEVIKRLSVKLFGIDGIDKW